MSGGGCENYCKQQIGIKHGQEGQKDLPSIMRHLVETKAVKGFGV